MATISGQSFSLSSIEHKRTAIPKSGRTASGYGRKLATSYMVKLNNRWRRVYCCCFSNSGTCYVDSPNGWIIITD